MRRVTLVVGAPCSGKSTYVAEHAAGGDTIIDWDQLAMAAGSPTPHDHEARYKAIATARRHELERQLGQTDDVVAWVVRTAPRLADRNTIATVVGATDFIVLDPGMDVCLARARAAGREVSVDEAIVRWYALKAGARNYDKPAKQKQTGPDPRSTRQWQRVRKIVLATATRCELCKEDLDFTKRKPHPLSPSVDHKIPVEQGGAWFDLANLQPAHYGCNSAKRNRLAADTHRVSEDW